MGPRRETERREDEGTCRKRERMKRREVQARGVRDKKMKMKKRRKLVSIMALIKLSLGRRQEATMLLLKTVIISFPCR